MNDSLRPSPPPMVATSAALRPSATRIAVPPAGRVDSNPPFTVLTLLACVRRRWKAATFLGLVLGACAAFGVWSVLSPARPYAYTMLHFPAKQAGSVDHPDPPVNQQTQRQLLMSRVVLGAAIEDPEIAQLPCVKEKNDPVSWLIGELQVDFPAGSEIMKISLPEARPDQAKLVVDRIALTYIGKQSNEAVEYREKHLKKLREMVATAKQELDADITASGNANPSEAGVSSPEVIAQRQKLLNNEIDDARTDLKKIKSLLVELKRTEERLAERLAKKPVELTTSEFEPLFAQNPTAARHRQVLDDLKAEYDIKSAGLGPNNPTMMALQARIDAAMTRLESLRKELRGTLSVPFQEKLAEDLRKTREEIAKLQFDEQAKQSTITAKQKDFDSLRVGSSRAVGFKPAMSAKEKRVEELTAKLAKLESELAAPVNCKLVEKEAVIVRPNDAGRRMKMAGIAGLAFFGLAFAGLGFWEFRARRIGTTDDIPQTLGLRLMGTVPARPLPATQGAALAEGEWESLVNEAVDTARTIFLHSANMQNVRTVMVSSAVGGEGKTTLSVRLATSLARSGRKTLLIDSDMRNPSVHRAFGLPIGPGVADVLRGTIAASEALQTTGAENLWVLAAGECDRRSLQALGHDEFPRLLAEVNRTGFDFILVDSCPILPVADGLIVARHVDGVLLSLLADVSQVDRVNEACRKLAAIDVPMLGAVVNGIRGDTYGYGYGVEPRAAALT